MDKEKLQEKVATETKKYKSLGVIESSKGFVHNVFYSVLNSYKNKNIHEANMTDLLGSIITTKKPVYFREQYVLNDFLHGWCDIFADCLHKIYNYPIYRINNEYNEKILTHAYCKTKKANETLYIDIRGITNNFHEFIEEFEDFCSEEYARENEYLWMENIKESMDEEEYEDIKEACMEVLENYKEFYDIRQLERINHG